MNYGFVRVAAAIPTVKIAACFYNVDKAIDLINEAADKKASIIAFPELSITAYTCADLFGQQFLLDEAEESLQLLLKKTSKVIPRMLLLNVC